MAQKLFRKEELDLFKKHGCQDGKGANAIVVARLFHPMSNWTWYCTEYNPETDEIFGFVCGHEMEWGIINTLEGMKSLSVGGLGVERDICFKPMPLKEALERDGKRYPY